MFDIASAVEDADRRILEGPLAFEAFRFGLPLALGMALQTTFNLVDAYLVARLPAGEVGPAVGALGICDQLAAVGSILAYGVSTATATLISRRKGAKDSLGVARAFRHSLWILGAMGALFAVAGLLGAGFIVRDLLGVKGAVADVAVPCLRVLFCGNFTIFFLLHLTTVQRALGSSKTPVALLVLGNVLNLVLAVPFIYGPEGAPPVFAFGNAIARALHIPHMGLVGGAWATVIARVVTLVPITWLLVRRFPTLRAPPPHESSVRSRFHLDWLEVKRMLSLSWPSSAEFVVRILAMLVLASFVARVLTTEQDQSAQSAMGIVFRLDTMVLFVAMGWGNGAQTFVAQNLGAGAIERAKRSGVIFACYAAASLALFSIWLGVSGRSVLAFFDSTPRVLGHASSYLEAVRLAYPALAFAIVLANAITGAERPKVALVVDAVVLGALFPLALGIASFGDASLTRYGTVYAIVNASLGAVFFVVYRRVQFRRVAVPLQSGLP